MKVTGYELREAIKRHTLRRDTAASMFSDTLKKFPDEQKPTPDEVILMFEKADVAVAKLQTAQAMYNLLVRVEVQGQTMSLSEAIKRVGGAGRIEKIWRGVASPQKERYSIMSNDDERDPSRVRAERSLTPLEGASRAQAAAKVAAAFRQAIAVANATTVELEDLPGELFE